MFQSCGCKQATIYSNHILVEALQLSFSIAVVISLTKALDNDYKIMNSVLVTLANHWPFS